MTLASIRGRHRARDLRSRRNVWRRVSFWCEGSAARVLHVHVNTCHICEGSLRLRCVLAGSSRCCFCCRRAGRSTRPSWRGTSASRCARSRRSRSSAWARRWRLPSSNCLPPYRASCVSMRPWPANSFMSTPRLVPQRGEGAAPIGARRRTLGKAAPRHALSLARQGSATGARSARIGSQGRRLVPGRPGQGRRARLSRLALRRRAGARGNTRASGAGSPAPLAHGQRASYRPARFVPALPIRAGPEPSRLVHVAQTGERNWHNCSARAQWGRWHLAHPGCGERSRTPKSRSPRDPLSAQERLDAPALDPVVDAPGIERAALDLEARPCRSGVQEGEMPGGPLERVP